ncbi:MAG: N-acetyl-gamma-glutamyl-phosphate reductase [Myxococcota bacterium]|nr:N-acetyl-gamma-glutamyl-phosphate reductase [Myxococcota bacterium]MDW8362328.1 N-acetyl-gamma-glutamyl-phosphate reductase [Myxococcales bacterium]
MRVAVVGATGYTGAELVRLLLGHPHVKIGALVGHGKAGAPLSRAIPSLAGLVEGDVEPFDADRVSERAEVVFCALPHGASPPIVRALRARGRTVFDLGADLRLRDRAEHVRWYGPDEAAELASQAVYGLVELHADRIATADLVAVPGCYPTASILALAPLLRERLVEPEGIVIDAKSGVSGAGRQPRESTHFPEVGGGVRAYGVGGAHRHTPEIEQELSALAGRTVRVTFTPHLLPMTRGILASAYAVARSGTTAAACTEAARALYRGSPTVVVLEPGGCPDTLHVRGSARCMLSYTLDERTGRLLAQAAIDNLLKGAAAQAVQCMNVRFGWPQATGLPLAACWP